MNYKLVNNVVGWAIFLFAFLVYFLTMAPTASFWDCGEFIACSNELQVPHPPGAPFFLILGRLFAMLSFGDVTQVAFWVNMLSVVSGAFVALFTFWSVTHLARKLVAPGSDTMKLPNLLAIMGAGAVAALTATFADSVWFNSVEAEVYALSSFFTAIVVWLIFKWEARADEPDNLKWIILIAYIMGLSIGAHLLNLLTVPALAFVYYFKKYKPKPLGIAITFGVSVAILGFIQYGIIQTSVEIAWGFEKLFTGYEEIDATLYKPSGMGLPQGTGIILFLILTFSLVIGAVLVTHKDSLWKRFFKKGSNDLRVVLNTACWGFLVVLMGYSSYSMIVIRANADTPINENDPSSVASMISYLKREQYGEQYGDRPLFSGPRYNNQRMNPTTRGKDWDVKRSREKFVNLREPWLMTKGNYILDNGQQIAVNDKGVAANFSVPATAEGELYKTKLKDGRPVAINPKTKEVSRITDRYVWSGYKQDVVWLKGKSFFPRMHSPSHYTKGKFGYKNYIPASRQRNPNDPYDDKVTFGDDMRFFFDYQVRHMYLRYFMWNFSGRAGDRQDMGWEDGLFVRNDFPDELAEHQGRNHYYSIPLLLGLLGMVFLFVKDWKDGTSILLLFFFTGLAIVLYLNQTPQQPRERDYSYAGSFQTFAFWVGLAVIAIYDLLSGFAGGKSKQGGGKSGTATASAGINPNLGFAAIAVIIGMIAPILMGVQNWDDHSRSSRRVAPHSAYNLLNSCQKNGILFTNGDNDTFPLWYIQEVEGIRTDVRVVNLSLLNTDWYIDQMKKQQNESPPLPISSPQSSYLGDRGSTRPRKRGQAWSLTVDKAAVLENNTVPAEFGDFVGSSMSWPVSVRGGGESTYLLKQDWMILDIMTTNALQGWKRPIYFSSTIPPSSYIGLESFFYVEGLANRVIPVDLSKLPPSQFYASTDPYSRGGQKGRLNLERSYDLISNIFQYGNLNEDDLYLDDHIRRTIVGNLSTMIFRAANAFVDKYEFADRQITAFQATIDADSLNEKPEDNAVLAKRIAELKPQRDDFKAKADEMLSMVETKISDNNRGNEVFYPMFAGSLWTRMDRPEKVTEYFEKVISKCEAWMDYFQKNQVKLPDHDRIMGTLSFALPETEKLEDKSLASRTAHLLFLTTGQQQYENKSKQLKMGIDPNASGPQEINLPNGQ